MKKLITYVAGIAWAICAVPSEAKKAPLPPSQPIDVFIAGKDTHVRGNNNVPFAKYREQNIVVTNSGKVVVIVQGRNKSKWCDRSGQDLVCKTSDDSGNTWSKDSLVVTHGTFSICPNAAVYDAETNQIHVLYNLFHWDYTSKPEEFKKKGGWFKNDRSSKQYIVTSSDEGKTWSAPRDISSMISTEGAVMVVGSGEGIQLKKGRHKGRLIFAGGDFNGTKRPLCFYSDDHGATWKRSKLIAHPKKTALAIEAKIVELSDGSLLFNSRSYIKDGSAGRLRTEAISTDGGETWSTMQNNPDLKTISINASIVAVAHKAGKNNEVLLLSTAMGPGRRNGIVYASLDGGKTWPASKLLYDGLFAYSSLIPLPDGSLGLFFEGSGHKDIKLIKFDVDDVLK